MICRITLSDSVTRCTSHAGSRMQPPAFGLVFRWYQTAIQTGGPSPVENLVDNPEHFTNLSGSDGFMTAARSKYGKDDQVSYVQVGPERSISSFLMVLTQRRRYFNSRTEAGGWVHPSLVGHHPTLGAFSPPQRHPDYLQQNNQPYGLDCNPLRKSLNRL